MTIFAKARLLAIRSILKRWLIQDADPNSTPEQWPDGTSFFRGAMLGIPVSGLLWLVIIICAWRVLR